MGVKVGSFGNGGRGRSSGEPMSKAGEERRWRVRRRKMMNTANKQRRLAAEMTEAVMVTSLAMWRVW
ncbi:unnamed protein product [Arabis nemorensis]|uniref:Uncharacterized protein n=1 Tax=Arabis nemorensis TaxID=586526 RepID=A0A565BNT0_9BRAS|nr:unnamed protein product [Arabis nemorensis]